uniref:Fibronectin type-III domain-containing protein n=1 Tax=Cairina moschata TaxID=8855 RepID=A0A8C3BGY6_CAIMO
DCFWLIVLAERNPALPWKCTFTFSFSGHFSGSQNQTGLSCYNDYSSHVTCKWKEHKEAHDLLHITLYQNDNTVEMGKLIYMFSSSFHVPVSIHMLHLHLLVQPLPPQNLEVQNSSGDFFLTWTAAEGSQGLGNALEYEVTFKREWESWEDASRLLSNTTRCHLSHLMPGSRYIARVRARAQQAKGFSGPFSEWSTDVSWETPEGSFLSPLPFVFLSSPQTSQILNISNDEPPFIFTLQMLSPSTKYRGKMRAMVNSVDYQSSWSEWSEEFSWETENVSPTALDVQNQYHALNVTQRAPVVCLSQTAGHSFSVSRRNSADASTTSQTATTSFAFNGPYLYSPVMSSQPESHRPLDVTPNPVGNQEKSVSLQYVTLPNEVCPQAPRRQEQPGAGPQQPFQLPDQKETMQHLNDEKEVSPLPPASGQGTNVKPEEKKAPKALGCATSLQQCPSEYIATDSLLLPSASDSTHLPLATAGELPCDPQEPQLPSDPPVFFPESHLNAFEDYLVVPSGLHGPSEPTKISLPVLQKGSTLPNELPLSEGNLVVLNPDSTEPVFLCQVGDYCFHSLKSREKVHMSQEDPQVKKTDEARTAPGKPLSDDESNTGKKEDVSKMQAIQLFKSLKSDDYFSWQQSLRIREIC